MSNIITYLHQNKIDYAILKGRYDKESFQLESKNFQPDLDIVLLCDRMSFIENLKQDVSYQYIDESTFLDIKNNIRIDFYFKTLNVGYYHYLIVDKESFLNREVSESQFIIYQILDPLLKFSRYQNRHQFRLHAYFKNGFSIEVEDSLRNIIGGKLSTELLYKISRDDFNIRESFVRKCKCKMLFINGNFVKMLKARVFL